MIGGERREPGCETIYSVLVYGLRLITRRLVVLGERAGLYAALSGVSRIGSTVFCILSASSSTADLYGIDSGHLLLVSAS